MILGIIIGILIGSTATIITFFLIDRYIKMQCEDNRWNKYLMEMGNEQPDKNTYIE